MEYILKRRCLEPASQHYGGRGVAGDDVSGEGERWTPVGGSAPMTSFWGV
jgi:hypothetical protein